MLQRWLEKIFGTSYLTSVAGISLGIANALVPILQQGRMPTPAEWLLSLALAVIGLAAKSYNVTGPNK